MTVEGERDDISGVGQTEAAHALLPNLPPEKHEHFLAPKVGHYGVFNGSRSREMIQPRIAAFIRAHAREGAPAPTRGNGARAPASPNRFAAPGPVTPEEVAALPGRAVEALGSAGPFAADQLAGMTEDGARALRKIVAAAKARDGAGPAPDRR